MPKLFVAIGLPPTTTSELALVQPPRARGVRLVKRNQMHLTLHYIGRAGLERTAAALREVEARAFSLTFEGVGVFPPANGQLTLWAGVAKCAALLELHAAIGAALGGIGFRPEARPYTPHVTLARCGRGTTLRLIDDFLAQNGLLSLPAVSVATFGLYSSTLVSDVPVYRCEGSLELRSPEEG
jgi:2'-5' RNA ligase